MVGGSQRCRRRRRLQLIHVERLAIGLIPIQRRVVRVAEPFGGRLQVVEIVQIAFDRVADDVRPAALEPGRHRIQFGGETLRQTRSDPAHGVPPVASWRAQRLRIGVLTPGVSSARRRPVPTQGGAVNARQLGAWLFPRSPVGAPGLEMFPSPPSNQYTPDSGSCNLHQGRRCLQGPTWKRHRRGAGFRPPP